MKLSLAASKIEEQRKRINTIRDTKEVSPISVTTSNGSFVIDCNEESKVRMQDTINIWPHLGVTEVPWTIADNSVRPMDLAEVTEMLEDMLLQRGIRALQLHQYATNLKNQLPVSDNDPMFEESSWPV